MERIITLYNSVNEFIHIKTGSMWYDDIVPSNCTDVLTYFKNNNVELIKYSLENISQTNLTYGYDLICIDGSDHSLIIYKTFEKLLNEMNILPIYLENNILDIEAILPLIDLKCGFKVEFPEIFDYSAHSALICSRGKISSRMMYALYYVYNIAKNVENISEASVLEIGAGTGRTAYYAFKFGFKKYTIVDIISTQIVQAHYNFNLLGTDKVSLYGEDNYNNCFLNLCPADKFNYLNDTYDIICNFDGLTEYNDEDRFVKNIKVICEHFDEHDDDHWLEVKLMAPPKYIDRAVKLRDKIKQLGTLNKPGANGRIKGMLSLVPIRSLGDSGTLVDYTEEQIEIFRSQ